VSRARGRLAASLARLGVALSLAIPLTTAAAGCGAPDRAGFQTDEAVGDDGTDDADLAPGEDGDPTGDPPPTGESVEDPAIERQRMREAEDAMEQKRREAARAVMAVRAGRIQGVWRSSGQAWDYAFQDDGDRTGYGRLALKRRLGNVGYGTAYAVDAFFYWIDGDTVRLDKDLTLRGGRRPATQPGASGSFRISELTTSSFRFNDPWRGDVSVGPASSVSVASCLREAGF
jgi:hypothetical protein